MNLLSTVNESLKLCVLVGDKEVSDVHCIPRVPPSELQIVHALFSDFDRRYPPDICRFGPGSLGQQKAQFLHLLAGWVTEERMSDVKRSTGTDEERDDGASHLPLRGRGIHGDPDAFHCPGWILHALHCSSGPERPDAPRGLRKMDSSGAWTRGWETALINSESAQTCLVLRSSHHGSVTRYPRSRRLPPTLASSSSDQDS